MTNPYADDTWELKDPHSNKVCDIVSAKELWQRILEMRMQTGEPYIHYIDRSNDALPPWLKQRGLKVHQSNLCSEIILPTDADRTAVCCLSSVNLEYFDEWSKDKSFLIDMLEMLDNVLQKFINEAPDNELFNRLRKHQDEIYKLLQRYKSKANVPAVARSFMIGLNNQLKKDKMIESINERSNPSDKKELLRALKNSKVADVFSLNNDELVIEMTSPSGEDFVVGNIRKYKGD